MEERTTTVIAGVEVNETILDAVWGEEAGMYVLFSQPNDSLKRRTIRLMHGSMNPPLDEVVAKITLAEHQKQRISRLFNCIVFKGDDRNELTPAALLPKEE